MLPRHRSNPAKIRCLWTGRWENQPNHMSSFFICICVYECRLYIYIYIFFLDFIYIYIFQMTSSSHAYFPCDREAYLRLGCWHHFSLLMPSTKQLCTPQRNLPSGRHYRGRSQPSQGGRKREDKAAEHVHQKHSSPNTTC